MFKRNNLNTYDYIEYNRNKIIINNKELANMSGDVDSFFSHLDKVVEI